MGELADRAGLRVHDEELEDEGLLAVANVRHAGSIGRKSDAALGVGVGLRLGRARERLHEPALHRHEEQVPLLVSAVIGGEEDGAAVRRESQLRRLLAETGQLQRPARLALERPRLAFCGRAAELLGPHLLRPRDVGGEGDAAAVGRQREASDLP